MTQAFVECTCPPGHAANVGQHHPECSHANLDAQIQCSCCPEDHDHGAAANACPGNHENDACPEPRTCRIWRGGAPDVVHPQFDPATGVPPCPGGHCHKDVPGCTVCRPLIVTVLPGTQIVMAGQGS